MKACRSGDGTLMAPDACKRRRLVGDPEALDLRTKPRSSLPGGFQQADAAVELADVVVVPGDATLEVSNRGPENRLVLLPLSTDLINVAIQTLVRVLDPFRHQVDLVVELLDQHPRLVILVASEGKDS